MEGQELIVYCILLDILELETRTVRVDIATTPIKIFHSAITSSSLIIYFSQ